MISSPPPRPRRRKTRNQTRGSALITVILVVLVLTVVGIGVAYFTQVEDRISGNDRLAKTSFYAAETGLRTGEEALGNYSVANSVNTLLGDATPSGVFTPPGSSQQAKSFRIGTTSFLNRSVPRIATDTTNPYYLSSQYSLYIRNNIEDPGAVVSGVLNPLLDSDNKVNLIAVGTVVLPGGNAVTRVLEEQLEVTADTTPSCQQADCNQGGTGSIAK